MVSVEWHRRAFRTYRLLPGSLQGIVREAYENYVEGSGVAPNYQREFAKTFFDEQAEFKSYVDEFQSSNIMDEIERARAEHRRRTGHGRFAAINRFTHSRLYALVRKLDPNTVVETGVCNGVSTYIVLRALEENGHGHLYSVDYPDTDRLPKGEEPGWFIPQGLRDGWSLIKGMSQDELPSIVAKEAKIDMFIHDTIASVFDEEFNVVWPELSYGGVIVADDIHQSDVFDNITKTHGVDHGFIAPNVGYIIKDK